MKTAKEYLPEKLRGARTFKCEAKRSDKSFPLTSPQLAAECGAAILEALPHLRVQLEEPDVVIRIEVREKEAYIHAGQEKAPAVFRSAPPDGGFCFSPAESTVPSPDI